MKTLLSIAFLILLFTQSHLFSGCKYANMDLNKESLETITLYIKKMPNKYLKPMLDKAPLCKLLEMDPATLSGFINTLTQERQNILNTYLSEISAKCSSEKQEL